MHAFEEKKCRNTRSRSFVANMMDERQVLPASDKKARQTVLLEKKTNLMGLNNSSYSAKRSYVTVS